MANVPGQGKKQVRNLKLHQKDNNNKNSGRRNKKIIICHLNGGCIWPAWDCEQKECKGDAKQYDGHFYINCSEQISSTANRQVIIGIGIIGIILQLENYFNVTLCNLYGHIIQNSPLSSSCVAVPPSWGNKEWQCWLGWCWSHMWAWILGYGVGGWKFKKLLKVFDTGQFLFLFKIEF